VPITRILAKVFSNYDNQKSLASRLRAKRIAPLLKIIDDVAGKNGSVNIIDIGGTERARELAEYTGLDLATIEKRRSKETGKVKTLKLIGNVKNKKTILCDDIVASGKSLIKAAILLKKAGAIEIRAVATHGVMCSSATRDIKRSQIKSLILTNTIASRPRTKENPKIIRISAAGVFTEAIRRIHENRSISSMNSPNKTAGF